MERRHHQRSPRQREIHGLRENPKDLYAGLPYQEIGKELRASAELLCGAKSSRHHRPCRVRDGAEGDGATVAGGQEIQRRENLLRQNQVRGVRRLVRGKCLALHG